MYLSLYRVNGGWGGVIVNAWESGCVPGMIPAGGIKWRQWTGGGNKAVYCHRWGRVCDAVEVVGPSGGASGVQNKTLSEPLPEGPLHDQVNTFTVTPHCGKGTQRK